MPEAIVHGGFARARTANTGGWNGYYARVAIAEGENTVLTVDDDFERFDAFATEVSLSLGGFRERSGFLGIRLRRSAVERNSTRRVNRIARSDRRDVSNRHAFGGPATIVRMGFGSYDESEQQQRTRNADDVEAVNVHENDHDGQMSFESDLSTDELVSKLGSMKDDESSD